MHHAHQAQAPDLVAERHLRHAVLAEDRDAGLAVDARAQLGDHLQSVFLVVAALRLHLRDELTHADEDAVGRVVRVAGVEGQRGVDVLRDLGAFHLGLLLLQGLDAGPHAVVVVVHHADGFGKVRPDPHDEHAVAVARNLEAAPPFVDDDRHGLGRAGAVFGRAVLDVHDTVGVAVLALARGRGSGRGRGRGGLGGLGGSVLTSHLAYLLKMGMCTSPKVTTVPKDSTFIRGFCIISYIKLFVKGVLKSPGARRVGALGEVAFCC